MDQPTNEQNGGIAPLARPVTQLRSKNPIWMVVAFACLAYVGLDFGRAYLSRQSVYHFLETASAADSFEVTLEFYDENAHRLYAKSTKISDAEKVGQFATYFAYREPLFDLSDISGYTAAELPGVRIHSCTIRANRGSSSAEVVGGGNNLFCTTYPTGFLLPAFPVYDAHAWLLSKNDWIDVDIASANRNNNPTAGD